MQISACFITKNEEKNIEKAICSLQGMYDELIVTDTGSEDRTVEIAEKYGARVYNFKWQNDFSLARNFTIDKAGGDWIIFLDADEYFIGKYDIRDYLEKIEKLHPKTEALLLPLYDEFYPEEPPFKCARVFRNRPDIRYHGAIHEVISKDEDNIKMYFAPELQLMHSGYHPDNMSEKLQRNLTMLLVDCARDERNETDLYYIAECYFGLKQYDKAIEYITKAIASPVRHYQQEANYYHILLESMRQCNYSPEKMIPIAEEAIRKFPNMPEFYGEQGIILSSLGRLHEAFFMLNRCVELYECKDRQKQNFGYFTHETMGIIYARLAKLAMLLGKREFARLSAAMAVQISQGEWGQEEREALASSRVIICIPVYRTVLNVFEQVSLKQLYKVLGKYPIVFIAPQSLQFDFGELGNGIAVERFPDYYFTGILSYSALMLNGDFYQRFQMYEYMLVYQLDAFVFSDRLSEFCALGYDYIGAPVYRADPIWHFVGGRVGNGGLSLRKISSAIRMLKKWEKVADKSPLASIFRQWEDVFWGYCGRQKDWDFKVPGIKVAREFAVQGNISHVYRTMKNGWRPFGCHGWWRMNYNFWRHIIESCGYDFSREKNEGKELYPWYNDYLQSRSTLNISYLWGLYCKKRYSEFLQVISYWLDKFPAKNSAWQINMENFIMIWRVVENEQRDNKLFRIICQRNLAKAIQNSIYHGVGNLSQFNLLVTMIAYLHKYDYPEIRKLSQLIETEWWKMWRRDCPDYSVKNFTHKKRIAVIARITDEEILLESFIRHSLSFADVIIVDSRMASEKCRLVLHLLEQEEMPIIFVDKEIDVDAIKDDIDIVLKLSVRDFLMPQHQGENVRYLLEALEMDYHYSVEMGKYRLYLPYVYQDKFVLARPLLRVYGSYRTNHIIFGTHGDTKAKRMAEKLYLIHIEDADVNELQMGIIPADCELTNVGAFVPEQELHYRN